MYQNHHDNLVKVPNARAVQCSSTSTWLPGYFVVPPLLMGKCLLAQDRSAQIEPVRFPLVL